MTMSDNELQQMKTSDSERQHVEKTNENARKQVKWKIWDFKMKQKAIWFLKNLFNFLCNV